MADGPDTQALGVPAEAYDRHVGRYGAQLAAGLVDVAGVGRDSGRLTPLLQSFWDAALAVAPEQAGTLDEGRRIGYRAPAELGVLWEACGLRQIATGQLRVETTYESFDDLFAPFAAGAGHSGATFLALEKAKQRRLRAEAHRLLGGPDGSLTLAARAWWARGRAAAAEHSISSQ